MSSPERIMAYPCPIAMNCSKHGGSLVSFDVGRVPSYLSLASCCLSVLGSVLILVAYFTLKDIRTGAQKIITLLAMADLFTASGYIAGSVNFLTHFNHTAGSKGCKVFTDICEVQSFVTTWSTMSSYCWTCFLAFYFFLILVFHKSTLASKLLPLYNVVSWLGPLLVVIPLLATQNLGFAPYVASNWCYIRDTQFNKHRLLQKPNVIALLFVGGKFWEIISYFVVIFLYLWIKIYLSKTKKVMDTASGSQVSTVEKRLLAIPVLYIMLRMWGTLQLFYSLIVDHTNNRGCIPVSVQRTYFFFAILQAIGDGGQGWGNALLYIFLSPNIRRRLFGEPFDRCLVAAEHKFQELLETETMSRSTSKRGTPQEKISITQSGHTVTGGQPAKGYGVKNYTGETTTCTTTTTTGHTGHGYISAHSQTWKYAQS